MLTVIKANPFEYSLNNYNSKLFQLIGYLIYLFSNLVDRSSQIKILMSLIKKINIFKSNSHIFIENIFSVLYVLA